MRINVTLDALLASPLHIGSGARADSLADKPLVKDARGFPIIPGSSLRGKTRHACERIVRSLGLRAGLSLFYRLIPLTAPQRASDSSLVYQVREERHSVSVAQR